MLMRHLLAGAAIGLLLCGVAAAEPVRSLIEIRRDGVIVQQWDLSCGAAALGTLLRYEFGQSVSEKEIARGLMKLGGYVKHPERVQLQQGFSLLDLATYVEGLGFEGEGLGQLTLPDLVKRAPVMVPIDALGYNHFVVFRGMLGNRVLLADPAWGNRTMTVDKFQRMWIDYGIEMGHVGFVVLGGKNRANRLQARAREFVMLN